MRNCRNTEGLWRFSLTIRVVSSLAGTITTSVGTPRTATTTCATRKRCSAGLIYRKFRKRLGMNAMETKPRTDDVQLLMDTFKVSEADALKMIMGGWNVDFMKNGIGKMLDTELKMDEVTEKLKDTISESVKHASELHDDLK